MKTTRKRTWGGLVWTATLIAGLVAGTTLLPSCANTGTETVTVDEHTAAMNRRDSVINGMLGAFGEIERTLDAIAEREQILAAHESGELASDEREAVLQDIEALGSVLIDNRDRIAELEAELKDSGVKMSVLRKKVNQLTAEVDNRWADIRALETRLTEKDTEIAGLHRTVDSVNRQVEMRDQLVAFTELELEETNAALQQTTDQMHQAYLAAGTKKELKEMGLLETRLLGPNTLAESIPENAFEPIDIRTTNAITLGSPKAELVTYHPEGSYQMVSGEGDATAQLEILQPDEFWKVSKYLVVSLK
jgi:hypothetical protein